MPKPNEITEDTLKEIVQLVQDCYEERDLTNALARKEDRELTYEERTYLHDLNGEVMQLCQVHKTPLTRILLAYIKLLEGNAIVVARELPPSNGDIR